MTDLLTKLEGGDRRSIGRVDEVIAEVQEDPVLFNELFQGMLADEPVVCMRAADAVEKLTADHPEWLQPHKKILLNEIAASKQQEVRWHWAQMVPRLELTAAEIAEAVDILFGYMEDKSKIVRTFAMQALVDLAKIDRTLIPRVQPIVEEAVRAGSPAMKSRGRKLLTELDAA